MNKWQRKNYERALNVFRLLSKAQEWHNEIFSETADIGNIGELTAELLGIMAEYDPMPVNKGTWRKDCNRLTQLTTSFIELERVDGMRLLAKDFWGIFHPTYKMACGVIRNRCTNSTNSGDCDYRFPSVAVTVCPNCNTPRGMCSRPPSTAEGRCENHGGVELAKRSGRGSIYQGRAEAYRSAMIPDLRGGYEEMLRDANYLSLTGEIGLIASRNTRLLQDMEHFDPIAVKGAIEKSMVQIEKSLKKIEGGEATLADTMNIEEGLAKIRMVMEDATSQDRRWDEIKSNAKGLAALVDAERRLLVDMGHMVTTGELELMNTQIVAAITTMATTTGGQVEDSLLKWMARRLDTEMFTLFKQAVTSLNIAGKTRQLILGNVEEALRRGENARTVQDDYEEAHDTIEGEVIND